MGIQGRRCFLCGLDAKVCGRSRSHEIRELQNRAAEIILNWKAAQLDQTEGAQIS